MNFFKALKDFLFGENRKTDIESVAAEPENKIVTKKGDGRAGRQKPRRADRDPIFIQVGFDFGTSYSKCICRDVWTNKAWVHCPTGATDQQLPFLIPSTLLYREGRLSISRDPSSEYRQHGLNHIKIALEKTALKDWGSPVLKPYRKMLGDSSNTVLAEFVKNAGIFYLANSLANVKKDIVGRYPDFGQNDMDYTAINLAVPVADAERPEVNELFHKVLWVSWSIAEQADVGPETNLETFRQTTDRFEKEPSQNIEESCFIYPEVSANVQGFVRSRVSKEGVYLFSDTGAGTVDQSVFIFFRRNGTDFLSYLHASLLPLGSSCIEQRAAMVSGDASWMSLESWRKKKEMGGKEQELQKARTEVFKELVKGTKFTLGNASKKLFVKKQLHDIRVIFGGGGDCRFPYNSAVENAFRTPFFPENFIADSVGLPVPKDLDLHPGKRRWMTRLSVAYGLSFVKDDLASNIYPSELRDPEPSEIQTTGAKKIDEAPTKDVC